MFQRLWGKIVTHNRIIILNTLIEKTITALIFIYLCVMVENLVFYRIIQNCYLN